MPPQPAAGRWPLPGTLYTEGVGAPPSTARERDRHHHTHTTHARTHTHAITTRCSQACGGGGRRERNADTTMHHPDTNAMRAA
jgi:hypothetical protein